MTSKANRLLGIREIAAELGCCTRTVRRLHSAGKLPTFKAGSATSPIRISDTDLKRYKRKRESHV